MHPGWNWKGETLLGEFIPLIWQGVHLDGAIYWFGKYEPIEDEL